MGGQSVPAATSTDQRIVTGWMADPGLRKRALGIIDPALSGIHDQQQMLLGFQKSDPNQTRKLFGLSPEAPMSEISKAIAMKSRGPDIQMPQVPAAQQGPQVRTAASGGIMDLHDDTEKDPRKFAKGGDSTPKDINKQQAAWLERANNRAAAGKPLNKQQEQKRQRLNTQRTNYTNYQKDKSGVSDAARQAGLAPANAYIGQAGYFGGAYDPATDTFRVTNPYYNQAINVLQGMNQQPQQFGQATDIMNQAAQQLQAAAGKSWDSAAAQQYMSPYIETALKSQQDLANRQFAQQQNQLRSQAAGRGAFGGSASALAEQASQQNQNITLKDLVAQGMNQAYQQGMQGFMSDQARAIQALNQMGQMGQGLGSLGTQVGNYGSNLANLWGQAGSTLQGLGQNYFNQIQQNAANIWGGPATLAGQGANLLSGAGGQSGNVNRQNTPGSAFG